MFGYHKMPDSGLASRLTGGRPSRSVRVILSYAMDWLALVVVAGIAGVLGHLEPKKRPFSLVDPLISFPHTAHETVPPWLLLVCSVAIPIVIVFVVSLVFVPGPTVPRDTPRALVWQRKLWELHVGLLGLALALVSAWFFTESMKNMYGKPRPDLLDRCDPDMENWKKYVVGGGQEWQGMSGRLVSAGICRQKDKALLNDGFRSYPSGHSSSSAAGLIYTSLFLASKFAVVIPYVLPSASMAGASSRAAFPSRMRPEVDPYEPSRGLHAKLHPHDSGASLPNPFQDDQIKVQSLRRQAAAPPIYLLVITLMPFCLAIFIASSRWFDFYHHGFDILFGFLMGTLTSIYAFRYYHLPIRVGAGWAWGPRSADRAFWAGVGVQGYAGDADQHSASRHRQQRQTDFGETADTSYPPMFSGSMTQRPDPAHRQADDEQARARSFQEVELQQMGNGSDGGSERRSVDGHGYDHGTNQIPGRF